jgi:prepilin-type N-terminal cleavage/methylation domain-containing protein
LIDKGRGMARGMTLMEVLIAVTLVALLSVGMLYSLRAGLGSVETIDRRVEADRRASGAQRILEQEFAHLMPVIAPCRAGAEGIPSAPSAFFDGEPQVMRFVSAYSLEGAARGQAKILEMFVIPGSDRNSVRLVVNELPYFNPLSAGVLCFQRFDESSGGQQFLAFAPPQAIAEQLRTGRSPGSGELRVPRIAQRRALGALDGPLDESRCPPGRRARRYGAAARRLRPDSAVAAVRAYSRFTEGA